MHSQVFRRGALIVREGRFATLGGGFATGVEEEGGGMVAAGLWHREGALQQGDDYIGVMVEKTASGSWCRCRDTLGTTASSPLVQMEKG